MVNFRSVTIERANLIFIQQRRKGIRRGDFVCWRKKKRRRIEQAAKLKTTPYERDSYLLQNTAVLKSSVFNLQELRQIVLQWFATYRQSSETPPQAQPDTDCAG
uniref:Uncharacterized protein n=1 Tax=Kalanchoe fedtschenkoi TaxID=63787 RepID=A0A7N1A319_KALFE